VHGKSASAETLSNSSRRAVCREDKGRRSMLDADDQCLKEFVEALRAFAQVAWTSN
jgi:hypothetical protein